jgi:NADPH-dependent F420 reductase
MDQLRAIAVLGGSGGLGSALARRWAQAGYLVIIGSRTADRAIEAAALIGQQVRGAENVEAAKAAEVIVVAVPYSNHARILEAIRQTASGKIVVDVVVPLVPPKVSVVQIPQGGSAALLCDSSIRSSERSPNGMSFGLFNPWCEQRKI